MKSLVPIRHVQEKRSVAQSTSPLLTFLWFLPSGFSNRQNVRTISTYELKPWNTGNIHKQLRFNFRDIFVQHTNFPNVSACNVPLAFCSYVTMWNTSVQPWDMRSPKRGCCRLKCCGMLHRVCCKIFADVSKDHTTFIFTVKQFYYLTMKVKAVWSFEKSIPFTNQHSITSQDLFSALHHFRISGDKPINNRYALIYREFE
jgi:hypothetical protein